MSYELIVAQLKKGKMPVVTGLHLSQSQADEIKSVLEKRRQSYNEMLDEYFDKCIAARVLKSQSMSG